MSTELLEHVRKPRNTVFAVYNIYGQKNWKEKMTFTAKNWGKILELWSKLFAHTPFTTTVSWNLLQKIDL